MLKTILIRIIILVIWCFLGVFACNAVPIEWKYLTGYMFGCGSQIILLYDKGE